jgi:hypothetical protein
MTVWLLSGCGGPRQKWTRVTGGCSAAVPLTPAGCILSNLPIRRVSPASNLLVEPTIPGAEPGGAPFSEGFSPCRWATSKMPGWAAFTLLPATLPVPYKLTRLPTPSLPHRAASSVEDEERCAGGARDARRNDRVLPLQGRARPIPSIGRRLLVRTPSSIEARLVLGRIEPPCSCSTASKPGSCSAASKPGSCSAASNAMLVPDRIEAPVRARPHRTAMLVADPIEPPCSSPTAPKPRCSSRRIEARRRVPDRTEAAMFIADGHGSEAPHPDHRSPTGSSLSASKPPCSLPPHRGPSART